MNLDKVIKKPIISEKSTDATAWGKYSFLVAKEANKKEISRAIEKFFKVHPLRVRTAKLRKGGKKAIVQLAEGEKIDLFAAPAEEGVKKSGH